MRYSLEGTVPKGRQEDLCEQGFLHTSAPQEEYPVKRLVGAELYVKRLVGAEL